MHATPIDRIGLSEVPAVAIAVATRVRRVPCAAKNVPRMQLHLAARTPLPMIVELSTNTCPTS